MNRKNEILLLNSAAALPPHQSFTVAAKEMLAPLGLYCLADISPDRICVVDLQYAQPAEEIYSVANPETIRTVVVRAGRNHDRQRLQSLVAACRQLYTKASVGLAGTINKEYVGLGDFYLYGTGSTSLLNVLRGQRLQGFINSMQTELEMPLPVPQAPFVDSFGFAARPEKTIARHTLEVAQPWLGLHEFSERIVTYPGLRWISQLTAWLKNSGFAELHFRPSGLKPDQIHELRSLLLNQQLEFAVSFRNPTAADLAYNCAGAPLRQIWLYGPNRDNSDQMLQCLLKIREAGCVAGLQADSRIVAAPEMGKMLAKAQRLDLVDVESWQLEDLKKVLYKFWGTNNRFFKRLFNLRSAQDLINFMKTSAFILEILFSTTSQRR